jgi:hypothetical protein
MTPPVPYPEYPAGAPQPMFFQEIMAAMVGLVMLVALGAWAFSQVRKAVKGEEVKYPGLPE